MIINSQCKKPPKMGRFSVQINTLVLVGELVLSARGPRLRNSFSVMPVSTARCVN
jgi:hypothetical protein